MIAIPFSLPVRVSILPVSLVGTVLFLVGCEAKNLGRHDASARAHDAATEPAADPSEGESESVMPPQNIAGAFLVECQNSDVSLATTTGTRILCSLRDGAGNKSSLTDISWTMEPNPGPDNLVGQELLPSSSNWHVAFMVRADYFQQNALGVVASFGTFGEKIRLEKDRFTPAGTALALVDRTTEVNHQPVAAATLGSRMAWSKIYQDPVSSLFVSNVLDGAINFTAAEGLCAQLDANTALQGPWRLPSRKDITLLYWLRADLIADFSDWFWTGETFSSNPTQAYYGILYDGQIFPIVKTSSSLGSFCVADQLQ